MATVWLAFGGTALADDNIILDFNGTVDDTLLFNSSVDNAPNPAGLTTDFKYNCTIESSLDEIFMNYDKIFANEEESYSDEDNLIIINITDE